MPVLQRNAGSAAPPEALRRNPLCREVVYRSPSLSQREIGRGPRPADRASRVHLASTTSAQLRLNAGKGTNRSCLVGRTCARKFRIAIPPVEVHPSARKHRITDADARLYLGPASNAELLEVVTIVHDDGSELAIHAMKMRPKCRRLLPEADDG
jgi:hypothetical protein